MLNGPLGWFARQRLTPSVVALWVAGAAATPIIGGRDLPVPRLVPGVIQYVEFLPSLAAAAIVASLVAPRHLVPEARSRRSPGRWERWWAIALLGVTVVVWMAGTVLFGGEWDLLVVAVRDLVGFTGLGLVARALGWGPYAPALSVLFALAGTVLGYPGQWVLHWPLEPADSFTAAVVSLALGVIGLAAGTGTRPLRADARR